MEQLKEPYRCLGNAVSALRGPTDWLECLNSLDLSYVITDIFCYYVNVADFSA